MADRGMKLARDTYNWDRFADDVEAACAEMTDHNESRVLLPTTAEPSTGR